MANVIPARIKSNSFILAGAHHRSSCSCGIFGGGGRGAGRLRKGPPTCGTLLWAHARFWKGHPPRRSRALIATCSSFPSDPESEENFWEQEEGKKKLGDIEDMKELIDEARKLKGSSSSSSQQDNQQQANTAASNDESVEPDQAQKLSEELAKRAKEQAERRRQAEQMFQLGQRAYGRGMYDKAVKFFEGALTNIPGSSHLGGEVQVWLAMAYEADGKHARCIALYKSLENNHPSRSIRRQAKDLRYILEAPKLKISREEMVTIPLIGDNNSETRTWSKMYKERRKKFTKKAMPTKDYMEDWLVWNPPRWERSPYFWVAVTVWLTLVGIALVFQD
ncbi:hypothetical protein GOP47_0010564 [Adiantum capillus-veneris]|uniref:Uncharacterized protein n=1 Tax=Adiantum capillus-veneris TaxID=13818 RepID=A0A9D4ZGH0_ADICA|nr:hypothetical protein GOP47_0010564 [Adiantum capillus-veneris]